MLFLNIVARYTKGVEYMDINDIVQKGSNAVSNAQDYWAGKIADTKFGKTVNTVTTMLGGGASGPRLMLKEFTKSGGQTIDIAYEYPWTFTTPEARKNLPQIPTIILTEYEQDANALYSQLAFWKDQVTDAWNNANGNPYKSMYYAKPTGLKYILPFFEQYHTRVSPKWGEGGGMLENETFKNVLRGIGGAIAIFKGGAGENSAPGLFMNKPKQWTGAEPATYVIQFSLFNTIGDRDYVRNDNFLKRLRMSVSHSQVNMMVALPPAIFTVSIPGVRYSPAATITGLSIENQGQINQLNKGANAINVPDAYKVQITITELILESRQIIQTVETGDYNKVVAINEDDTKDYVKEMQEKTAKSLEDARASQAAKN